MTVRLPSLGAWCRSRKPDSASPRSQPQAVIYTMCRESNSRFGPQRSLLRPSLATGAAPRVFIVKPRPRTIPRPPTPPHGTHSPLRRQLVSIVYAPSANRMVRAICATAWDRRGGVAMCWGGSRTPIRNVTPQIKIEGHTENPIHGSLIRLEMTNPGTVRGPLNINGPHLQMGRSVDKR